MQQKKIASDWAEPLSGYPGLNSAYINPTHPRVVQTLSGHQRCYFTIPPVI